jgi:hypothetical protein
MEVSRGCYDIKIKDLTLKFCLAHCRLLPFFLIGRVEQPLKRILTRRFLPGIHFLLLVDCGDSRGNIKNKDPISLRRLQKCSPRPFGQPTRR